MASIVDLPPELLNRICELIPSQTTLAKFVRCSHQFYDVGAPHLYQAIDLSRTPWNDGMRHLERITALLLRKPELGRSVRHLGIHESRTSPHVSIKNEEPLLPEIQQALESLVAQTGKLLNVPSNTLEDQAMSDDASPVEVEVEVEDLDQEDMDSEADGWSTATDEDYVDEDPEDIIPTDAEGALKLAQSSGYFREAVVLALFISSMPKLTSLDLELKEPSRMRFVQALLRSAVGAERLLSHVHTVCFGSSRPDMRLDLWRDLFTLPSISSVYMHRVLAQREKTLWGRGPSSPALHPMAELQRHSLDIAHLEMRDCRISPWDLRRMLAVPKALRTFIYDIGEEINRFEPAIPISYKSVREALEQQKDSLEQIWIDYPHDYLFDEWGGAGSATRPMGSFAKFTKLKKFRIASTYLFGFTEDTDVDRLVESLPEQLESLHLAHGDEDEEITAGLGKLLEAKQRGQFPELKELKVETSLQWLVAKGQAPLADHTRFNKDVMAELSHKAEGLDLEMTLFVNHSQSRTYNPARRLQSANRLQWTGPERKESRWGFDGEVKWPQRTNGCMQRPEYPEVKIDDDGTIRFAKGGEPANAVPRVPTILTSLLGDW